MLAGELARLGVLGVRLTCNHRVTDLAAERAEGRFDAVFVAVGAHLSKHVDIPARDASRIIDAVPFLRDVAGGARPVVGRRVAVYGGGNTAMDAARVARRLGAQDTMIVYRRNRERMPAHEQEAAEAEQEGVRINWLRTITAFDGPELTVEVMELDEEGRPQPTGRLETLAADTIIMVVGQDADTAFLRQVPGVEFQRDGSVVVSQAMMTGCPGVFAGGDMVPDERTVTVGVGHGKKAARFVGAYLSGGLADLRPGQDQATFDRCTRGISPTPSAGTSPSARPPAASPTSPRWSAACGTTRPGTRRPAACRAATASNATGASVPARRTRSSRSVPAVPGATSTGRTTPTSSTTTGAPAAGSVTSSVR